MSPRLRLAALLGAMVFWFLPLGSYRLFNPDEGRYAEIAREMAASGDWVTPRLDALRYFEKPPLQYWATAAAYQAFGESEWSARLWAALTGFLRAGRWWTLLALAVIALPWVLLVERRNPGFAQFFFVHEHFTRFLTRVHQRYEPDWFFIPVLLLGFMPWTPLLPALARCGWRDCRSGHGPSLLLAIWLIFGLVFFSLSQSKLLPYT